LHGLAERRRLIRYDGRGTSLSDRNVADISFAGFVRDFEAVVDAIKVDRFRRGSGVAIRLTPASCKVYRKRDV
jgi:pimeloyl-ACP methyl ester carboxylesterase